MHTKLFFKDFDRDFDSKSRIFYLSVFLHEYAKLKEFFLFISNAQIILREFLEKPFFYLVSTFTV